ncbi:MAG TPA: hypothetical protein VIO37_12730 [Candidatus Dormibacteraeota bacterium]
MGAYLWEVAKEVVSIAGLVVLIAAVVALFVTGTLLPLWVGLVIFAVTIIVAQARVYDRSFRGQAGGDVQSKIVNVAGGTPTLVINVHAGGQVVVPSPGPLPAAQPVELPPPAIPDQGVNPGPQP